MRFAIPLADGKLTAHFGHCQEFAIIDAEENEIKNKEILVPPPHEPGVLPRWLHQLGTDIVIAGGIGHKAIDLFKRIGISIVAGAPSETPEMLVESYMENTLAIGDNLCAGGDRHSCNH